jgi:hypothetical protein
LDTDSLVSVAGPTQNATGKTGILTGSFQWVSNDLFLYEDGTQTASSLSFETVGATSNTVSLAGAIGANAVGGAEWFSGLIAELLIYETTDATGSVRANVHSYLYNTYGGTNVPSDFSGVPDEWIISGDSTT